MGFLESAESNEKYSNRAFWNLLKFSGPFSEIFSPKLERLGEENLRKTFILMTVN